MHTRLDLYSGSGLTTIAVNTSSPNLRLLSNVHVVAVVCLFLFCLFLLLLLFFVFVFFFSSFFYLGGGGALLIGYLSIFVLSKRLTSKLDAVDTVATIGLSIIQRSSHPLLGTLNVQRFLEFYFHQLSVQLYSHHKSQRKISPIQMSLLLGVMCHSNSDIENTLNILSKSRLMIRLSAY